MDNCANNYSVIILASDILRRVIKQFLSIIIYIYLILGLRKGVLTLCTRHYQSGEALPEEYYYGRDIKMSNSLFRKASLDSLSSPEQLNDYIKVSNPSIWIVLMAMFILLAVVLIWSFTGSLPTSIHTKGVVNSGKAVGYVDITEAGTIKAGQAVKVQAINQNTAINGHIDSVGVVPLSASEIAAELKSDYLAQALAPKGFAVTVDVSLDSSDLPDKTLVNINIVTDTVRPIDFLLK